MKRILCFGFCLFTLLGYSQDCPEIILQESFENYSGCGEFHDGCTGNWCSSHGFNRVHIGGVCDGNRSAEFELALECGSQCEIFPQGPGDVVVDPGSNCALGGGIFYEFETPLPPGTYQISFCYCVKVTSIFPDLTYRAGITAALINDVECNPPASVFAESFPFDIPIDPTPSGNPLPQRQVLHHNTFLPWEEGDCFQNEELSVTNLTFTTTESFSQLWFYGWQANNCNSNGEMCIDNVILSSLDTEFPCEEQTDLTACGVEGDFGYIVLDCPGEYEWEFPAGSTAIEFTSGNTSIILNADEGIYTVTITNAEGCQEVRMYEIVADCCEPVIGGECDLKPPLNPHCELVNNVPRLVWEPVADAIGYNVYIEVNSPNGGCCEGPATILDPVFVTTPYYLLDVSYICASWYVTAICKDKTESEPSEYSCLGIKYDCRRHEGEETDGGGRAVRQEKIEQGLTKAWSVFPNPAREQINVQLEVDQMVLEQSQLILLNRLGQQIYQAEWSMGQRTQLIPTAQLSPGVYWLQLVNDQEVQLLEEIVIVD